MSSSPRRQSSATGLQTEDCPSISLPPLTGTSILIEARVSTSELQALEANTELNNTHPPRPIDYQPSVNGCRRTRFTLSRLLCAAILTVFTASKFIDSVHGKALTLNLLDLIAAILVFMSLSRPIIMPELIICRCFLD
ncbi:hypothetical protein L210DRAFT_2768740 [Boletus edulis BED1]|uniref:Uncharacterized protein n=1 Tax=Boletus edulis BED1 TaxID=1328754 RepID=A0AAD4BKI4_BOLED|nr:hypothetical protein L210DRAFT_2768740 [Boletus edulis BED1]